VIAVFVLLGLAAIGLYLFRRRKHHQEETDPGSSVRELDGREGDGLPIDPEKPELEAYSAVSPNRPFSRSELAANRSLHGATETEMGGTISNLAELEGYQVPHTQYEHVASQGPTELYTGTPRSHYAVIFAIGEESPEEIERLAQEEQRLDAKIAEAERLREL
jgi:hypothetical protein